MHSLLDEIFLTNLEQAIETQQISQDDEEEQKELNLKKQYQLYSKEVEELRKHLEELQDKQGSQIQESLHIFETKKDEWSRRFRKLQNTGQESLEGIKSELTKWKDQTQSDFKASKDQVELKRAQDHPHRLYLI